jgi:hypothetical protein
MIQLLEQSLEIVSVFTFQTSNQELLITRFYKAAKKILTICAYTKSTTLF